MPNSVYDSFSDDYKSTLQQISTNFQEDLFRIIGDNFERNDMYYSKTKIPVKETGILVRNGERTVIHGIELLGDPKYIIKELKVDFRDLSIKVQIDIKDINITAGTTTTFSSNSPFPNPIEKKLPDMKYLAMIGMKTEEDSFVPENFYNKFICETDEISADELSSSTVKSISHVLIPYFVNKFYREITGTVVDFSLSELLIDEPEEMKRHEEQRLTLVNAKIDGWLNKLASKSIQFDKEFNFRLNSNGTIIELSNIPNQVNLKDLVRKSPSSFFNDSLYIVNGELNNSQCVIKYKTTQPSGKTTEGTLTAKMHKNKLLLVFDTRENKVKIKLGEFSDVHFFDDPKDPEICTAYPYFKGYLFEYYQSLYAKISTLFEDFQH